MALTIVFVAIHTIIAALFAWAVWGLSANSTTSRQRQRLIDYVFAQPDWKELSKELDRVSYLDHNRAVMLFRDPAKLYSERLQAAFD